VTAGASDRGPAAAHAAATNTMPTTLPQSEIRIPQSSKDVYAAFLASSGAITNR
jgi:hypothetical protein